MDNEKKDDENIGSFYMGRVRPPPEPKRILPPGVLTIIALTALGGIIWYAYPHGAEKYTNVDVPLVKADTAPIKAAPANPGGMEVRHQDSTVFDPLKKNADNNAVAKLLPTPEEPMDKTQAIKAAETKPPALPSAVPPKLDLQMKDAGNGVEEIVPTAKPAPVKIASAAPPSLPVPKPAAKKVQLPKDEDNSADDADDDTAAKKATHKHTASSHAASSSGAAYEVQLGSYAEIADAKKDWDRLKEKYASYLGDLKMRLVKVEVTGKGTRYHLQAGAITKDRAHEICAALKKSHGVGCILANK